MDVDKWLKNFVFLFLGIIFLCLVLYVPTWPSKTKLCQNLESFIPIAECLNLDSRIDIIKKAFTVGETSSVDIKSSLGDYIHEEYPTSYGHRELYYLQTRPIDFIFGSSASYDFSYDTNGILTSFDYEED
jgi:hypothetical protein